MGRFSPTERPEYYGGDPGTALAQAFQNHVTQGRLAQQAADQHILSTVEAVRSGYQPPTSVNGAPAPQPNAALPQREGAPAVHPALEAPQPAGVALGRELGGGDDPMAGDPGWGSKVHAPTSLAGVMQAEPSPAPAASAAAAAPTSAPSAAHVAGAFDPALGGFAPARITPSAAAAAGAAPSNTVAPPAGRELASAFGGDGRVQLPEGGSIDPYAPERRQLGMYGAQQRIAGDERIRGERVTREDEFQLAQRSIKARYEALDGIQGITEPQRRAAALDPKVYEELANPYNPNSPAGRAAKLGDESTLARLRSGLDMNKELALGSQKFEQEKQLIPLKVAAENAGPRLGLSIAQHFDQQTKDIAASQRPYLLAKDAFAEAKAGNPAALKSAIIAFAGVADPKAQLRQGIIQMVSKVDPSFSGTVEMAIDRLASGKMPPRVIDDMERLVNRVHQTNVAEYDRQRQAVVNQNPGADRFIRRTQDVFGSPAASGRPGSELPPLTEEQQLRAATDPAYKAFLSSKGYP